MIRVQYTTHSIRARIRSLTSPHPNVEYWAHVCVACFLKLSLAVLGQSLTATGLWKGLREYIP